MKMKKTMSLILAAVTIVMAPVSVFADREDAVLDKPYISLGADLNSSERATVLQLLGVTEEQLKDYTVVETTNKEEHKYLDSYLDSSVIGSRALSSVLVEGKEDGNGIKVTTQNISYCTVGMYQNALVTAGLKNADIKVVGPFKISGTAGLVGAIKAYEEMTGMEVKDSNVETATNELVVTSQLADKIKDPEKAEELVGIVKNQVAAKDMSEEELGTLIDETAQELEVNLSQEDRQRIMDLMDRINDLDLNVDDLQQQIKGFYDKVKDMDLNIHLDDEQIAQAEGFLTNLWNKIVNFFSDLFN